MRLFRDGLLLLGWWKRRVPQRRRWLLQLLHIVLQLMLLPGLLPHNLPLRRHVHPQWHVLLWQLIVVPEALHGLSGWADSLRLRRQLRTRHLQHATTRALPFI